jgi:hydrogenase large subunit
VQAIRFRNLSNIAENLQSDLRQTFLMFMVDFTNEYYKDYTFFEIANKFYKPFNGEISKKILNATKDILKVIAHIGGQWPHTSHMVPGGLNVVSDDLEILNIKYLIEKMKIFIEELYDEKIDKLLEISSFKELQHFINTHPNSQISIFYKILEEANLFNAGVSGYPFINFGALEKSDYEIPRGIYDKTKQPLNIDKITEDVTYCWYDGDNYSLFEGKTIPNMDKENAYSFSKAPRYDNKVYQTGPLGEWLILDNPLFKDLYNHFNDSVFVREFARVFRPIRYIKAMQSEVEKIIKNIKSPLYEKPKLKPNGHGIGLTHAARGVLGHWVKIKNGKIEHYQIISPTTWNGSPKDKFGNLGPWEKALIGTKIDDIDNPIEMGHIIRSFDPCLVCSVHFIGSDKKLTIKV